MLKTIFRNSIEIFSCQNRQVIQRLIVCTFHLCHKDSQRCVGHACRYKNSRQILDTKSHGEGPLLKPRHRRQCDQAVWRIRTPVISRNIWISIDYPGKTVNQKINFIYLYRYFSHDRELYKANTTFPVSTRRGFTNNWKPQFRQSSKYNSKNVSLIFIMIFPIRKLKHGSSLLTIIASM
jgi:hypothetical protein